MIWGPVSGGENIPDEIKIKMTIKERIVEKIRVISQTIALWLPSIRATIRESKLILVATEETKNKIPSKYLGKTHVIPAIGLTEKPVEITVGKAGDDRIKIVMAGRLIYWKAFDIGIKAFLSIVDKHENIELHILGQGNKKAELVKMAGKYLNKQIFDEPVPHDEICNYYKKFDLFLNTTLRDSGCMTMMEALSVGLPCIALDTGGPHVLGQGNPCVELVQVKDYDTTVFILAEEIKNWISCAGNKLAGNTIEQNCFANKVKLIEGLLRRCEDDK